MKIVVKFKEKGLFKALGFHHGFIVAAGIIIGHFLGIGEFMAAFGVGWYACKEYGGRIYPPPIFEILDFLNPCIFAGVYFYLNHKGII